MNALIGFLFKNPFATTQILTASFFVNLFGLASSIFVIQVYNRYLSYGNDGTLITLAVGMGIAMVLELGFRKIRYRHAEAVVVRPGRKVGEKLFFLYTHSHISALEQLPPAVRMEMTNMVGQLQNAFTPTNLLALVDVPYALLYILAIFLLNPLLGLVALGLLTLIFVVVLLGQSTMQKRTQQINQSQSYLNRVLKSADELDTVRAFNGSNLLSDLWDDRAANGRIARRSVAQLQDRMQTFNQVGGTILTISMIGLGAQLAVVRDLDFGSLIGVNILAGRALALISRFSNISSTLIRGQQTFNKISQLERLPVEAKQGTSLSQFSGRLEFRDVAFSYPQGAGPLFESLSFTLNPGEVLVVTGNNGTGKTTLARLLLGLIRPIRGSILADGLDLRQLQPEWWRKQVIYLPQEPTFLDATIHENITLLNPEMEPEKLTEIIRETGLQPFVSEHPEGLNHRLTDGGRKLSLGIRRRLALARALASEGRLVILDEPTEGMDNQGSQQVAQILNRLASRGSTVLLFTHDRSLFRASGNVLDLNIKPTPKLSTFGSQGNN
jgi:ATP-binding cassette, subfamily C, bacterial LapB